MAGHVLAFERRRGNDVVVVIASRLLARWLLDGDMLSLATVPWADTRIRIVAGHYVDVLGNEPFRVTGDGVLAKACLETQGVAVLERQPGRSR